MAELADAPASGAGLRKEVQVQVLLPADMGAIPNCIESVIIRTQYFYAYCCNLLMNNKVCTLVDIDWGLVYNL